VPSDKDIVITKYRYSGFTGTNLDQVLRSRNILTVITTGVITQVCVEATVRAACDLDYRVVVVDDCTATTSQEIQKNALDRMAAICADRVTSDVLLGLWGND
jgi:nicotinamidase-related amidase